MIFISQIGVQRDNKCNIFLQRAFQAESDKGSKSFGQTRSLWYC